MKFDIKISTELTVEFDENNEVFKEMYDNFNQHFVECSDYQEFVEYLAQSITRLGISEAVEGIGLVQKNGEPQISYFKNERRPIIHPVNVSGDFEIITGLPVFEIDKFEEVEENQTKDF